MNTMRDPVPHWTRQVGRLRMQFLRLNRVTQEPGAQIAADALELCDGLLRDLAGALLECDRLRSEVRNADAAWEHLFQMMPLACLLTDSAGSILRANRAAASLLNTGEKRLKDRQLALFSEDREGFSALVRRIAAEADSLVEARITFRPRERRASDVDVLVGAVSRDTSSLRLWFLTPVRERHAASGTAASMPVIPASVRGGSPGDDGQRDSESA